jgi:hypothetical protein
MEFGLSCEQTNTLLNKCKWLLENIQLENDEYSVLQDVFDGLYRHYMAMDFVESLTESYDMYCAEEMDTLL